MFCQDRQCIQKHICNKIEKCSCNGWKICKYKEKCNDRNCPYPTNPYELNFNMIRHIILPRIICTFFKKEKCLRGNLCTFLHI